MMRPTHWQYDEDAPWAPLLDAWFGELQDGFSAPAFRRRFFVSTPAHDESLRTRFGADCDAALRGDLDAWRTDADGALALVLLLDQLPRNLHRGTARAFASDARAREVADAAIDAGFEAQLPLEPALFLWLPFEHSEDRADQHRCVQGVTALRDGCEPGSDAHTRLEDYLQHALEHQELIARFGRFPHRNVALSREDTPEESQWLASTHRRFGQGDADG